MLAPLYLPQLKKSIHVVGSKKGPGSQIGSDWSCLFLSPKPTTLDERRPTGLTNLGTDGQRTDKRRDR